MHWSPTMLLRRGADFTPRAHGDTPTHKWSLPPQEMCTITRTTFWTWFYIKAGRKKRGWKGIVWEEKRVNAIQITASRQRKTKRKKFSLLTFLIPTLPLLLKCWCWLGTPAVENYTGSVTSLSPLLEQQYRAAYGERKTSIKRKTVAWEYLVVDLSLSIW